MTPAVYAACFREIAKEASLTSVIAQRAAGNTGLVGLMLESHLFPGSQPLGKDLSQLKYGVSITDACIGWDETEALLHEAAGRIPATAR